MMRLSILPLLGLFASLASPAVAASLDVWDTNPPTSVAPDFIGADGLGIDGFQQSESATGGVTGQRPTVSMRARDADLENPDQVSGNRYFVDPGASTNRPSVTNLLFDYQFDPGTELSTPGFTGMVNYQLKVEFDFDPAVGAASFLTFDLPIFDADRNADGDPPTGIADAWQETDGFFLTNGDGSKPWNDQSVPYVVANSFRLDFNNLPAYDRNADGEYEFRISVSDESGNELASTNGFAVVPEPASIALAGVGALALLRRRR